MLISSGSISPNSATVKAAIPPRSCTWEASPPVYVNFLSTHQNTLSCLTPNSASRWASSREHTWVSNAIIGLTPSPDQVPRPRRGGHHHNESVCYPLLPE